MKSCRWFLLILCCTLFLGSALAQSSSDVQPNSGSVDGSRYTSSFFNFTYYIPEQWTVRSVAGRMPGTGLPLLLSLKKNTDAISAIMITAVELPSEYNGDLGQYLEDRFRPAHTGSQMTINGISTSRLHHNDAPEAELLSINGRNFYRLRLLSPGISRVVIGTLEKKYAIVFELVSPASYLGGAETQLTDSLHALFFAPPKADSAVGSK